MLSFQRYDDGTFDVFLVDIGGKAYQVHKRNETNPQIYLPVMDRRSKDLSVNVEYKKVIDHV